MKYDTETIKIINLFEALTGAEIKNFFIDKETYIFVIDEKKVPLVLGQNKKKIKKLSELFRKKIRIIGVSKDINKTIKNLIYPIKPLEVEEDGKKVIIKVAKHDKPLVIGREKKNLKVIQEVLKDKEIIVQ